MTKTEPMCKCSTCGRTIALSGERKEGYYNIQGRTVCTDCRKGGKDAEIRNTR